MLGAWFQHVGVACTFLGRGLNTWVWPAGACQRRGRVGGVVWICGRGLTAWAAHRQVLDWRALSLCAPLWQEVRITRVSLHDGQAFRLLLKTSVERDVHEFCIFLEGLAHRTRPAQLLKKTTWCALAG